MTDDEFAALDPTSRDFAVRWLGLTEDERERFCRQLLAAIEVLQRMGIVDGASPGEEDLASA